MFHPTNQGFFPLLFMRVDQSLSPEERAQFESQKSLQDRIKFVNGLPRINGDDPNFYVFSPKLISPVYGEKSSEKSAAKREAGNAQFYSGNFKQAQLLYSVAVFVAPKPTTAKGVTPHYALALANRSACSQKLHLYQLAIDDADLALDSGYPSDKAFKLYERKGECLHQLSKSAQGSRQKKDLLSKAIDAYRLSIKSLQKHSGLPKDKIEKFSNLLQSKISQSKECIDTLPEEKGQICETNETTEISIPIEDISNGSCFTSPMYPSAHSAIEIKYEEGRGRFAVASKDIPMGTTLIRENPITYALHPERFGTHCQHCFAPIRCVIPCPECSWVCFCSIKCRDEAVKSYHKSECGIMKLILESGLNIYSFLTLRAVCSQGLQALLDMREDLEEKRNEANGADCKSDVYVYQSSDFRNLYNLMAHEDSLSPEEWLLRTMVSLFILKALINSGFFGETGNSSDPSLTTDQLYIGSIIFRLLNICPCNSHDISEFETPTMEKFGPTCTKVSLGAGMFPTLALFNHSCDPSFMRCNKGNSVLCMANRLIKKGEEISENYGLMYTAKDFDTRQKILKNHYKFECNCSPCIERWPTLMGMAAEIGLDPDDTRMTRFLKIRCSKCKETIRRKAGAPSISSSAGVTCLVCGSETDLSTDIPLKDIKALYHTSVQSLVKGQWKQGIEAAAKCDRLIDTYLSLPLLEMAEIQVAIWKCMWLKFGSMKQVKII